MKSVLSKGMTTAGGFLVKIGAAKSKAKLHDKLILFSCKQLTSPLDIFKTDCNDADLKVYKKFSKEVMNCEIFGDLLEVAGCTYRCV